MKTTTFFILLFAIALTGFATTHTITNSGTTFSPSAITISQGDTVIFTLGNNHNAVEVSQTTWNANGNTSLPGFSAPFGGGMVLPEQLTAGTHYYVCTPHAAFGMKGTITVTGTTSLFNQNENAQISLFPNPSNGIFQLNVGTSSVDENFSLEIFSLTGEKILTQSSLKQNTPIIIDLSGYSKGIYFLQLFDGSDYFTRKFIIE
jgi:plastocyanin